ncbi:hypothetical protein LCGC14_1592130 [marine sediment metagenome]|uniref:Uncharacterized protein n=1 Tax=marine sediment metagenome TaxID=412755 RepID=A0A0F9KUC7_9ZZZZ
MKSRTRHDRWPTAALADGLRSLAIEATHHLMRPEHVDLMRAAADRMEHLRDTGRELPTWGHCGCTEERPCGLHTPIVITAPTRREQGYLNYDG